MEGKLRRCAVSCWGLCRDLLQSLVFAKYPSSKIWLCWWGWQQAQFLTLFCLEKLKQRYLTPQGTVQNWGSGLLDYTQCVLYSTQCVLGLWDLGLGVEITISNNCLSLETTLAINWGLQSFCSNYECLLHEGIVLGPGAHRKRLFSNICYSILHLHKTQSEDCILTRLPGHGNGNMKETQRKKCLTD